MYINNVVLKLGGFSFMCEMDGNDLVNKFKLGKNVIFFYFF